MAYAYIRVSTDEQAERGRSGLPRQILHIHDAASEKGYKISWDFVYADDFSGFILERPELGKLFRTLNDPKRKANAVFVEDMDRLSREHEWHFGYLKHQITRMMHAQLFFWKEYKNRVERAVMGAVAQEGMEQSKERRAEGVRRKARDGRVTSRKRAYGFKFVDDKRKEGERARKFTHYAVFEDEAVIVREIFQRVCRGETLSKS